MNVLRDGLLDGIAVALGADGAPDAICAHLGGLGARTLRIETRPDAEPGAWAAEHGPLHALVFDGTPAFGAGGDGGLMAMLDAAWAAVLELATDLIAGRRPGKLVLLAPAPGAGPLAGGARDALENLARTLSIEWARHGITTCAVTPGDATSDADTAQLIAYLLSPAGDYFTGCRLALGEVAAAGPA